MELISDCPKEFALLADKAHGETVRSRREQWDNEHKPEGVVKETDYGLMLIAGKWFWRTVFLYN